MCQVFTMFWFMFEKSRSFVLYNFLFAHGFAIEIFSELLLCSSFYNPRNIIQWEFSLAWIIFFLYINNNKALNSRLSFSSTFSSDGGSLNGFSYFNIRKIVQTPLWYVSFSVYIGIHLLYYMEETLWKQRARYRSSHNCTYTTRN